MADDTDTRERLTQLLGALGEADPLDTAQRDALAARVYPELRDLAGSLMARERAGHTLQPTALVNEAWVKLVDGQQVHFNGRAHFFAIAARCMRQVLVDHARGRAAEKRGGQLHRVTLDENVLVGDDPDIELIALDQALDRLAALDERAARVAEMRIFGGMTVPEVAHELGVSARTVDGDWATARLWLTREMTAD